MMSDQSDDPVYDQNDIIDFLEANPGMTWEELQAVMGVKTQAEQRGFMRAMYGSGGVEGLLGPSGRVAVVQFTTWAPYCKTTHRLFPMEHGRITVPDADDGSDKLWHFVHDPYDLYEKKMAAG